jgi:cytochrome c peroxidase
MRKQTTFNVQEKNGYNLFKKNCSSCHKEPLFTNLEFENNGLPLDKDLKDLGRMRVTKNPKDSIKFKVSRSLNRSVSFLF